MHVLLRKVKLQGCVCEQGTVQSLNGREIVSLLSFIKGDQVFAHRITLRATCSSIPEYAHKLEMCLFK